MKRFLTPELLPFAMNLVMLAFYMWKRAEPGKLLYWLGACILTIGLMKMKG